MKKYAALVSWWVLAVVVPLAAQEAIIAPPENTVVEGVPNIPASLVETAGRYSENRSAFPTDWHPQRREILIGTRFGNTYQAHLVKMPGGARQQLTFFTLSGEGERSSKTSSSSSDGHSRPENIAPLFRRQGQDGVR
jgi:hypothetical protein